MMPIEDDQLICERQLNQVGNRTLNVNLPAKWLRLHGITPDNYNKRIVRMECSRSAAVLTLRIRMNESL